MSKLGGKERVLNTHLSKEGLEVQPQIAPFFPTHETSLLTSMQATVVSLVAWGYNTRLAKGPTKKWLATSRTGFEP